MLTLSKDYVKRIWTEVDGGKLNVFISCDSSLNADVRLVFLQPRNIPEMLKDIFGKQLAQPKTQPDAETKTDKVSKSAGTLLIDTEQDKATKNARKSVPEARSSNFVPAPKLTSSQEVSDLPCAQPYKSESDLNEILNEKQETGKKEHRKLSISKPMNFLKRYRPFSRTKKTNLIKANDLKEHVTCKLTSKKIASKEKSKASVVDKSEVLNVAKLTSRSMEVVGILAKEAEREDVDFISLKKMKDVDNEVNEDPIDVPGTNQSYATKINDKVAEKVADWCDSASVSISEAQRSAKINVLLSDWDEVADSDSLMNKAKKSNAPVIETGAAANESRVEDKRSRLSYSGRRVRAQRKATKRKQDEEQALPVKKRISFDDHEGEAEAAQPLRDQKNHDTNSVPTLLQKEKDDEVQLPTSEGVGHESIDMNAALTLTHKETNNEVQLPIPEIENLVIFEPAALWNDPQKEENLSSKLNDSPIPRKEIKNKGAIKSRKSKVLFSGMDSMMMEGGSGVDEQQLEKDLKKITPVSYDDIHVKHKLGSETPKSTNKSSTKKPKVSISPKKIDPSPAKTKPKRSYIRKKTPQASATKSRKSLDPFSLSITPKKNPRSIKKSNQKKPAPRRSTKLFSDDSIVDSMKRTPEKTFSAYSLKVQDAGDKSLEVTSKPEKATRQQRETRKKVLTFLEHISGLLSAAAEFDDRVTR